jgi:hypothetical protein
MQERDDWIKSLKPGDVVCDCRNQHRKIVRIRDYSEPKGGAAVIGWVAGMASVGFGLAVQDAVAKVTGSEVTERFVYFADGSHCRATTCLDPAGPGCLHS